MIDRALAAQHDRLGVEHVLVLAELAHELDDALACRRTSSLRGFRRARRSSVMVKPGVEEREFAEALGEAGRT